METMTNELAVIPRTIGMMTGMMDVINPEIIVVLTIINISIIQSLEENH